MRHPSFSERVAKLVHDTQETIRRSRQLLASTAHLALPADRRRPAEEIGAAVTPAGQDRSTRQA